MEQSPRSVPSRRIAARGRAGIAHVRLELCRPLQRIEGAEHRLAHLADARAIDETADHQVAVTPKRVRRQVVHGVVH